MKDGSWSSVSPMVRTSLLSLLMCVALVGAVAPASAQQTSSEAQAEVAAPSSTVVTTPQSGNSAQAWLERDLEELRDRVSKKSEDFSRLLDQALE